MTLAPLLFAIFDEADAGLARRLKRRDPEALADLYDRYGRLVYSLIVRIVRDTGVAEDLVQETFLRVWTRSDGFDDERGALGGWLVAVARNRALDHVRSSGARMARYTLDIQETENPSAFRELEAGILNADRVRRVRAAFEKLNPNQRVVIELAYFEGLSQTEMAERLGQPLGTIKTWVRTALKLLREEVGVAEPA